MTIDEEGAGRDVKSPPGEYGSRFTQEIMRTRKTSIHFQCFDNLERGPLGGEARKGIREMRHKITRRREERGRV